MVPSYSQFGEDRLIESFFSGREHGFYVDVGCNHPIAYSNTWKLYLRGWRGIVIDANPALISEYATVRPADIAINKVISCSSKPVEFYFAKSSHLISGIGPKENGHWQRTIENSDVIRCETARLCDILLEHNVRRHFELLSIDTEGNELDVLNSLCLDKFKPLLIAVEVHSLNMDEVRSSDVYTMLTGYGYKVVGYARPTIFFASRKTDGKNISCL